MNKDGMDAKASVFDSIDIQEEHTEVNNLKTFAFNVGQGDHTLLQLEDGRYGIIDFYYEGVIRGISEPPAITYFRNLPKEEITIAFICITHADKDHLKGMEDAFIWLRKNKIKIEELWIPKAMDIEDIVRMVSNNVPKFRKLLNENLQSNEKQLNFNNNLGRIEHVIYGNEKYFNYKIKHFEGIDENFFEFNNFKVKCFGPLHDGQLKKYTAQNFIAFSKIMFDLLAGDKMMLRSNANRNSISSIFLFEYFNNKLFFPGDATKDSLTDSLKGRELNCNFIKAPHHGAATSSAVPIWEKVIRKTGLVNILFSAGKARGTYLHPSTQTYIDIDTAIANFDTTPLINKLKTNKCTSCVSSSVSEQRIETRNCDIFAYDKLEKAKASGRNKRKRKYRASRPYTSPKIQSPGLLGYYFKFNETNDSEVVPEKLLCKGMKTYPKCIFDQRGVCDGRRINI